MADDKVAIWGSGLKFGRKPVDGELLIGNGQDLTLATLTAGPGASITNAAGSITIGATGTGVGTVTASAPLASSGGTSPDISLTGTVAVANGGTGLSTLTANNVILGNGASNVQFVAPGASGNLLTSDGTTWTSAAPPVAWGRSFKTSNQTIASSTVFQNCTGLSFPVSANKNYSFFAVVLANTGGGNIKVAVNGPASPTALFAGLDLSTVVTAYDTSIWTSASTNANAHAIIDGVIQVGANAGTFTIRFAQNVSNATGAIVRLGSWIEWAEVV